MNSLNRSKSSNPKYKNQITIVDGKKFMSKMESEVYLKLKELYGVNSLDCAKNVELLPRIASFKKKGWKIDFIVKCDLFTRLTRNVYIEAKGKMTELYKLKLHLLAHLAPYIYEKLIIVSDDEWVKKNHHSVISPSCSAKNLGLIVQKLGIPILNYNNN